EPAGDDALAIGLLAKLGRVFLLVPLCFIFIYIMKRKSKGTNNEHNKVPFPFFLIGFILMSIFGSYVLGHSIPVTDDVMEGIYSFTTWILTAAMVGLGLNVSLQDLRTRAFKPLMAMVVTSVIVSVVACIMI